ncbi:MAG: DUF4209 domain-containing protein [Hyphomicrobiales bacterium]
MEEIEYSKRYWLEATAEDFENVEFEECLTANDVASLEALTDCYKSAYDLHKKLASKETEAAVRVFAMLKAATNLYFKPEEQNAPFAPVIVMADGSRSPSLEDFRGLPLQSLAKAAEKASQPLLAAHLSDMCWMLERSRYQLGTKAVEKYLEVFNQIENGSFKLPFSNGDPYLEHQSYQYLLRAMTIAHKLGSNGVEKNKVETKIAEMRSAALSLDKPSAVLDFSELDFQYSISPPDQIGQDTEAFLSSRDIHKHFYISVALYQFAANAYKEAGNEGKETECRIAAAEMFVTRVEKYRGQEGVAIMAASSLQDAISAYHGIPGTRERRLELRQQLIEVQAEISGELTTFSQDVDLTDVALGSRTLLEDKPLKEKLSIFASISRPPHPDQLKDQAIEQIIKYPFSSMFGASHMDGDGKTVARTDAGGVGDGGNEDSIKSQIAKMESTRRFCETMGKFEPCRTYINEHHFIGSDTFIPILLNSPFVPIENIETYAIGFRRYFEGDFTSAIHILTPMLENSLRHILKLSGSDVTTFDAASQTQQDRTITALFDAMGEELQKILGEAILFELKNTFVSKPGPYVRHQIAHGLAGDSAIRSPDVIYACWLVFRLCCLPVLRGNTDIKVPE